MHLVALLSDDPGLKHALRAFRDGAGRFHLHPVPTGEIADLLRAMQRLDFAGALVVADRAQAEAQRLADRSSLEAQDLGAADVLTVTPAGIIADHTFGRAVASMLASRRWHAEGAHAVVLGATPAARAIARELARLGVASLTLLADDRVAAEQALSAAAGTAVTARSRHDPLAQAFLERADLLVRIDPASRVDEAVLGPHLTVIDFEPGVSELRRRAMELGSLTFGRHDVEAYRFEHALSQVLGGPVGLEPIRALFQAI